MMPGALARRAYRYGIQAADLLRSAGGYEGSKSLSVVVPCVEKDAAILPHAIAGVRAQVKNRVDGIYVVSPASGLLRDLARRESCTFVDERQALPLDPSGFSYTVDGHNRKGWILQQLIKLNADAVLGLERMLILDADTIFVSPQHFFRGGKTVFNISDEYHEPYYRAYQRLLGTPIQPWASFVSHHQVMESEALRELRAAIEAHTGKAWFDAIISVLDPDEMSSFSEYETYGNFFRHSRRPQMALEHFWNRRIVSAEAIPETVRTKGWRPLKSVSIHNYESP